MKLFVLALSLQLLTLTFTQSAEDCGECKKDACPTVEDCKTGVAKDNCGCCDVCSRLEGQVCGGDNSKLGRCVEGLVCSKDGKCECEELGRVCGSNDEDYVSVCALKSESERRVKSGEGSLEVAYKGYCKRAPKVDITEKEITQDEGTDTYFHCEGRGVPTPQIRWYFGGQELPGDFGNINTQARKGEGDHEMETWAIINGIEASNAGKYECKMVNSEGEASATGTLIVNLNLTKKTEL